MTAPLRWPGRFVERVQVSTPLGIRFWDPVSDTQVTEGLEVYAWPLHGAPAAIVPIAAARTASGVFAFHALPGLTAPNAKATVPAESLEFAITVHHGRGWFVPMLFVVALPLPYHGLLAGAANGSLPGGSARVPLCSSLLRPLPPGVTGVRADLRVLRAPPGPASLPDDEEPDGTPAAHAVVRVTLDGTTSIGIADERGRVLVPIAPPLADRLGPLSLPQAHDLRDAEWPVAVTVAHEPASLNRPLAGRAPPPWSELPSVRGIVRGQAAALLLDAEGGAPVEQLDASVAADTPCLLATATPSRARERSSFLWIVRGASLP